MLRDYNICSSDIILSSQRVCSLMLNSDTRNRGGRLVASAANTSFNFQWERNTLLLTLCATMQLERYNSFVVLIDPPIHTYFLVCICVHVYWLFFILCNHYNVAYNVTIK